MSNLNAALHPHIGAVVVLLAAVALILTAVVFALHRKLSSMQRVFERITRGVQIGNVEEILVQHLDEVRGFADRLAALEVRADRADSRIDRCAQHVAVVRFDAFEDVGGQQSFSCAILDARRTGIVISGIYGRTDLRVYVKHVFEGQSSLPLSAEETEAMKKAATA